jgi:putative ABC transport system ATP-binding protein
MILELLQKINKETGMTIVLITHAQAMAQLADRTAVIADGVISELQLNANPQPASEIVW